MRVLIKKKRSFQTQGPEEKETPHGQEGRQPGDARNWRAPADGQQLERGLDQRGTHPGHPGIPAFQPPKLGEDEALGPGHPVCGASSHLPQETDTAPSGHSPAQCPMGSPSRQPRVNWGRRPPCPPPSRFYPPQAEKQGLCFSSITTHRLGSDCRPDATQTPPSLTPCGLYM